MWSKSFLYILALQNNNYMLPSTYFWLKVCGCVQVIKPAQNNRLQTITLNISALRRRISRELPVLLWSDSAVCWNRVGNATNIRWLKAANFNVESWADFSILLDSLPRNEIRITKMSARFCSLITRLSKPDPIRCRLDCNYKLALLIQFHLTDDLSIIKPDNFTVT